MTQSPNSTELADPLADLDGEDIACLGMRRADTWSLFPARTDEDWANYAALPAPMKAPRKPRRPSIKELVEQAEKTTGKPVTAITTADGTRLELGTPDSPKPGNEVDQWMAKHACAPEGH
jgi:hypothetical protein